MSKKNRTGRRKGVVPAHLKKYLFKHGHKAAKRVAKAIRRTNRRFRKALTPAPQAAAPKKRRRSGAKKGRVIMSKGKGSKYRSRAGTSLAVTPVLVGAAVTGGIAGIGMNNMLMPKVGEKIADATGWDWLTSDSGQATLKIATASAVGLALIGAAAYLRRRNRTAAIACVGAGLGYIVGGVGEPVVGLIRSAKAKSTAAASVKQGMNALTGTDFDASSTVAGRIPAVA